MSFRVISHRRKKTSSTRMRLVVSLLAAVLVAAASPALATSSYPDGISLADLVNGASFESENGTLTFDDFQAGGVAPEWLDLYHVEPITDGFRLLTPLIEVPSSHSSLSLDYSVTAATDLLVDAVEIAFTGFVVGDRTRTRMEVANAAGHELAELQIGAHGNWPHWVEGNDQDESLLAETAPFLLVNELIEVRTGFLSDDFGVIHRFDTTPIPEPGTAILLGLGLIGLAFSGRRPGER